jgi:hypothetical protein
MTQAIDLMSTHAPELAEELCSYLSERFHITVRVREVRAGKGYRLFQIQKTGNRHLVDVRPVTSLPDSQTIEAIRVLTPPELIAYKVISYNARRGKPKAGTDWRDLAMLRLAFPELKSESGPVSETLQTLAANEEVMAEWRDLVAQVIVFPDDESEFD